MQASHLSRNSYEASLSSVNRHLEIPDPLMHELIKCINEWDQSKAEEHFNTYLHNNTPEDAWRFLNDLKTQLSKPRPQLSEEQILDGLWIQLAKFSISNGDINLPKRILLENQNREESCLRLQGSARNLLQIIIENYFLTNDIDSIKSLFDSVEKYQGRSGIQQDFVTDEPIDHGVRHCVRQGFIKDAIEISAKKSTPHDQGELLLELVRDSLKNNHLDIAKKLAEAIPHAPFLTNMCPREINHDIPKSWNKDRAFALISEAIAAGQ